MDERDSVKAHLCACAQTFTTLATPMHCRCQNSARSKFCAELANVHRINKAAQKL